MCWTGLKDECVHKVAQSNIPVTKIVKIENNNDIVSYFNGFNYVIGKTYKTNISFSYAVDIFCEINRGFHSYINEQLEKTPGGIRVELSNRFEMYYNISLHLIPYKLGILYCVIPKGSIYYQNKAGEIVSDTIKPIYCYKVK